MKVETWVVMFKVWIWTTLLLDVDAQIDSPKPDCLAPHDTPNWAYKPDTTGGHLNTLPDVNITLVCAVDTNSRSDTIPVWSRNGDADIPQMTEGGLAFITITTSLQDEGDILTCTTQSDNGETGQSCSITLHISRSFHRVTPTRMPVSTIVGDEVSANRTLRVSVGMSVSIGFLMLVLLIIVLANCIIRSNRNRTSQTNPRVNEIPYNASHVVNQNAQGMSSNTAYVNSEQTSDDQYYSSQIQNTNNGSITRQTAKHYYKNIQEITTVNTRNEEANRLADKNTKGQSISYAELDFQNNAQYSHIQNV